jgi:hypothetical protein
MEDCQRRYGSQWANHDGTIWLKTILQVQVINGKPSEIGKSGIVQRVDRRSNKLFVEGVNEVGFTFYHDHLGG